MERAIFHHFFKVFFVAAFLLATDTLFSQTNIVESPHVASSRVVVGAERLDVLLPEIRGKNVGLVVNQSSMVGQTHLVDTLCALDACVARIFTPEHGFRGNADAGELVDDTQDARTGAPIVSLYGKRRKPLPEDLENVDVVVFDIQDVGVRFYTYISTLFYVLEACAENCKPLIVLDRPNPNGHYTDGPVLDMRFASFLGVAPLPLVHGCTPGELALMFAGEYWIYQPQDVDLQIITCENYTHSTPYDLPVKPSPNLPNARSVLLYPSLGLFEGTRVSLGRGTDIQFQVIGHPDFQADSFWFVPRPNAGSKRPPHEGWICRGYDLRNIPLDSLRDQKQLNLHWLLDFYRNFPDKSTFFTPNNSFELHAGTLSLRQQMEAGMSEKDIRSTWQADLEAYRTIRLKYLLYPE